MSEPALAPQAAEPERDCPLCPRLAAFRAANRTAAPGWHNAPVPSFGGTDARLLVVGLAPGLKGANRTGRPFTGDYAGELLYSTLLKFGFATGDYRADPADELRLTGARITNAVRCVPPENRPTPLESATCRRFLAAEIFDGELAGLIRAWAIEKYSDDRDCQAWEPGGDEFLSPALIEALLMARVLHGDEFQRWFAGFLPRLGKGEPRTLFAPATVSDRTDGAGRLASFVRHDA